MKMSNQVGFGHVLAVFGMFLLLFGALMQGTSGQHIVAFGAAPVAELSNQYRRDAGLSDLVISAQLTQSAQSKADDMAQNAYFAHVSPNGNSPWTFFDSAGYIYEIAGENLALTNQSPQDVVSGWYNSPTHRANLLNSSYTEVGYGVSYLANFSYNEQDLQNVWLVAAHYALPYVTPVAEPTPTAATAPPTSTTQPLGVSSVNSPPTEVAPATTEKVATAAPVLQAQPIVLSQNKDVTTSPQPVVVAGPETSQTSQFMVSITIALGLGLTSVGVLVEIRRFFKHQRLIPRFHP